MNRVTLCTSLALVLATSATAQIGQGFAVAPIPFWIIKNPPAAGGTAPGTTIESVHHTKLSNNLDGEWTTALTNDDLEAAFGGDGSSRGVSMGIFSPYNSAYTPNTEANALNSSDDDFHLALSQDGLWAIFERKDAISGAHKGVFLGNRAAVGTAFGAATGPVTGFPASTLPGNQLNPYLGTVGGQNMCFYSDGNDYYMQPIDLGNAALTGTATKIGSEAQGGTQPASPSPIPGADGDIEALWACDIVIPQTGAGTGDADPTLHNDLMASTPGGVRVQRPDWQGWGGFAGGFCYFSHDINGFHVMHSEARLLLGDVEPLGGTVDLTTYGTNNASPQPLTTYILLGTNVAPPVMIPGLGHQYALASPLFPIVLTTSTTARDGVASTSFVVPNDPFLQGMSIPIQGLANEKLVPEKWTWTNTAWIHIQ